MAEVKQQQQLKTKKLNFLKNTKTRTNKDVGTNRKTTKNNRRTENTIRTKMKKHQRKTQTNNHGNRTTNNMQAKKRNPGTSVLYARRRIQK